MAHQANPGQPGPSPGADSSNPGRGKDMLYRSTSQWKRMVWLAAVAGLLLISPRGPAEPKPDKQDRLIVKMVCTYLQEAHLSRPKIDDELSKRLFKHFLNDLDPTKLYFLQEDVDEFKKQETELGSMLLRGNLNFAYEVYKRFVARIAERQKLIEELVNAPHDYTVKEYLN